MHDLAFKGDLLEHLRAFVVLANRVADDAHGAFVGAARELHTDVTVLRRRVAALEAWLGAPLLEGRGAALRVSRAGRRVASSAGRALGEIRRLRHLAEGGGAESMAVGCTGTVATAILPDALAVIMKRWPRLRVQVRRTGAALGVRWVDAGLLDFAVTRSSAPPDREEARRVVADRLWLVVGRGHALARGALTPARIARHPVIGYAPGSSTGKRVMDALAPFGAVSAVEVDRKAAALRYAELGLGVAFVSLLPWDSVPGARLVARDVTALFARAEFWLVWGRGKALAPHERAFVDAMLTRATRARSSRPRPAPSATRG
jgi:DNA-binding transcriptional LysR family regulator